MSTLIIRIIFLVIFIPVLAKAEYRAYRYHVVDTLYPESSPSIVTTAMNQRTFESYKGGKSIQVTLVSTWKCHGNTSGKETCPSPSSFEQVQP